MKDKVVTILCKVLIFILFTSCSTTVFCLGKMRNDILNLDPDIQKVGFIPNYTGTDDKFIAIDIIFTDGRRLFLTLVNYANRVSPRRPFILSRIGNYSFNVLFYDLDENQEVKFFMDHNDRNRWYSRMGSVRPDLPLTIIADVLDFEISNNNSILRNLEILINNYDKIYLYVKSLPEYNESFGDVFLDSLNTITPWRISESGNRFFILTRIIWDDSYFHPDGEMPDYEISESYTVIRFCRGSTLIFPRE